MAKEFNPNKTTVVSSFGKTDTGKTVVQIHEFDDKTLIDIRKFWKKKDDKEWNPSGSGISIPVEKLSALRKALKATKELLEEEANAPKVISKVKQEKKPTLKEKNRLKEKKRGKK